MTTDPGDISSVWRCVECGVTLTASQVTTVQAKAKADAALLDFSPDRPETCGVEAHEKYLAKYSQVRHIMVPWHTMVLHSR